ncbi:family 43 glycosylhydrolase [Niabella beijingensis]|uniref:family 43 glycosylhydrolase n=1 Tax=Niabella beijingensis TaxID=2872700 RepID=UPI001CC16278|nr:family 43 glycosylhydrolase [Niabella beijingensis]MBZ4191309.1 family 43 glycosylhydrolase [Niabella beijingensis]
MSRFKIHLLTTCLLLTGIASRAQLLPEMYYSDSGVIAKPVAKDPKVIYFKGKYLMYYSVPGRDNKNWSIGIAISDDLTHWKKTGSLEPGASYEKNGLCAPGALVKDGKVNLFYQTYGNGKNDAICHAVSEDGIHFTRNSTNPIFRPSGNWTCGRAIDAEVVAFKNRYFLYFATRDPDYKIQMQGVAATASLNTSFNRNEWTQLTDSAILKPELPWEKNCIEAASCVQQGKYLYMFYAGGYNNEPQQIGIARSADGIRWQRLSDRPFLPNGAPGSWNESESGHPDIFKTKDQRYYLFFQGNNDKGRTWHLSKKEVRYRNGWILDKE